MEKKPYQTAGKKRLLDFLSGHPDCQFTAEEICLAVNGNETAGRSSVYRHLDELCRMDAVRKFRNATENSVYQYVGNDCDCKQHFHAKCVTCGKIEHLDCSDSSAFAGHLLEEHGFLIDCGQSILWGQCADCRKAGRAR